MPTTFTAINLLEKENVILASVCEHINDCIAGAAKKNAYDWNKTIEEIKRGSSYAGVACITQLRNDNLKNIAFYLALQTLIALPFNISDAVQNATSEKNVFVSSKDHFQVETYTEQDLKPYVFYITRNHDNLEFRFLNNENKETIRSITNTDFGNLFVSKLSEPTGEHQSFSKTNVNEISDENLGVYLEQFVNFFQDIKNNFFFEIQDENTLLLTCSGKLMSINKYDSSGNLTVCGNFTLCFEITEQSIKISRFIFNVDNDHPDKNSLIKLANTAGDKMDTSDLVSLNYLSFSKQDNPKAQQITDFNQEKINVAEVFLNEYAAAFQRCLQKSDRHLAGLMPSVDSGSETDFAKSKIRDKDSRDKDSEEDCLYNSVKELGSLIEESKRQIVHTDSINYKNTPTFPITWTFIAAGFTVGMVIGAGLFLSGVLAPLGLTVIAGTSASAVALASSAAVGGVVLGALFGAVGYVTARIMAIEEERSSRKVAFKNRESSFGSTEFMTGTLSNIPKSDSIDMPKEQTPYHESPILSKDTNTCPQASSLSLYPKKS